jgi:hypothetical protein
MQYNTFFGDRGRVSKNSEAEQWFGGLFIASSLYTAQTRGFLIVFFVDFPPSYIVSRIFPHTYLFFI